MSVQFVARQRLGSWVHLILLVLLASCGGGTSSSYGGGGGGGGNPPGPMPGPEDRLLNGHYAFLFSGFSHGYYTGIGSFVADGAGNISGGIVDTNGLGGATIDGGFTGAYTLGSNNTGTMTLTYDGGATVTYALSIATNGDGRFIQYVASGVEGSGTIKKQDTTAFATSKISGNYVFGVSGLNGPNANRLAIVGTFQADGVSALSGAADGNNNGSLLTSETLTGSYAIAASGRGTATVNITGLGTVSTVLYVVSSNELFLMEIDSVKAGNPLLSGDTQKQTIGTFSNSSLNGAGVLQGAGLSSTPTAASVALLGLATVSTPGTLNIGADRNSGGTLSTLTESLTYSVGATGRVTTSGSSDAPVFYLAGTNQGFALFSDSAVTFGRLDAQSVGPFTNASIMGAFEGGTGTQSTLTAVESDSLTADGAGNLTDTYSSSDGTNLLQGTRNITYSMASNGRATLSAQGSSAGVLYMVSPTQLRVLSVGIPSLGEFQQ